MWLAGFAACRKNNELPVGETAVDKKIEFHVHAGRPYTDPYYNNVTADVKLEIYKINYINGKAQLLWDTAYAARSLSQYPHLPEKYVVEKSFPVLESSEKLQAKYSILYHSAAGNNREIRTEEVVPGMRFFF